MKRTGFTLIELLAVIIILAIVALIATPIILNVVEDAKKSAGLSEANMVLKGITDYCNQEKMGIAKTTFCKDETTLKDNLDKIVNLGKLDKKDIDVGVNDGKVVWFNILNKNSNYTLVENKIIDTDVKYQKIKNILLNTFPDLELGTNGCKTIKDNNYTYDGGCYLKGNYLNNYVWYSGFLWRIMGINKDGSVKMITEDNVTAIPYSNKNRANNWDGSHANEWLNNYFLPKLKGTSIISNHLWCSAESSQFESENTICVNNLSKSPVKIGMLAIDEYNLAGGTNSYLKNNQMFRTLSSPNESTLCSILDNGYSSFFQPELAYGIRAVININGNTLVSGGDGNIKKDWNRETGPFVINEDKNIEVKTNLETSAIMGEYVLFSNKKYRVVEKNNYGVKLILDDFYEEPKGTVYRNAFGDDNIYSSVTLPNSKYQEIGEKIKNDVYDWLFLNEIDKTKVVNNYKWYQGLFEDGQNFKEALKKEEKQRIKDDNMIIGLPTLGEPLTSLSSSILSKNYTDLTNSNKQDFWTLNRNKDNVWFHMFIGWGRNYQPDAPIAIRPVIVIKPDVMINGGSGTWYNPYKI